MKKYIEQTEFSSIMVRARKLQPDDPDRVRRGMTQMSSFKSQLRKLQRDAKKLENEAKRAERKIKEEFRRAKRNSR